MINYVYCKSLLFVGTSSENLACVRFGLITDETDLEELIALVYTTGKEVEESSKVISCSFSLLSSISCLSSIKVIILHTNCSLL